MDLTQLCLDIAGIVDPTPVSDGASALISLARGRWFDALVSGASMLPVLGDLAKAGKFPRYLKTIENAIVLAQRSADARKLLTPVMERLSKALDLLPDGMAQVQQLRRAVKRFFSEAGGTAPALLKKPDIRKHFKPIRRYRRGGFEYEGITGRLGVPGKVVNTGKGSAAARAKQSVSRGTGEHAGHRIGGEFGAPTDATNLSLQNPNMNTYAPKDLQEAFLGSGGSYRKLELEWGQKLKNGSDIEVTVLDKYRPGEARPISRHVSWTERTPGGQEIKGELDFGNFGSPQQVK